MAEEAISSDITVDAIEKMNAQEISEDATNAAVPVFVDDFELEKSAETMERTENSTDTDTTKQPCDSENVKEGDNTGLLDGVGTKTSESKTNDEKTALANENTDTTVFAGDSNSNTNNNKNSSSSSSSQSSGAGSSNSSPVSNPSTAATATACTHTYNSGTVTTAATCTNTGTKTYTCTKCGATKTESIAATGHDYNSGTVTTAATCGSTGTITYTCTRCGDTYTDTIAATENHSWQPIYKTVYHNETGHCETTSTPVGVTICNACGEKFYNYKCDGDTTEIRLHIKNVHDGKASWSCDGFEETITTWVVDQSAYDETVIDYYKCSACGAAK